MMRFPLQHQTDEYTDGVFAILKGAQGNRVI